MQNKRLNYGFSLIELIIVIGITAIIATIGFAGFYGRNVQDLDLTTREILTILRNAQDRSMSQEDGVKWGVYFDNPFLDNASYFLYKGTTTTLVSKMPLRSNIQFLQPISASSTDILFEAVNGKPIINGVGNTSTTIKIALKDDNSVFKEIVINSNGRIANY